MGYQSKEFDGLAALVTGGVSGIGLATARLLAERGAGVPSWTASVTRDVREPVLSRSGADVTDDAAVRAAVAAARELGGLDIAGQQRGHRRGRDGRGQRRRRVAPGPRRQRRRHRPGHPRGAAAPAPVRACGAIVNTCSIAAIAGLPQRALYSATKGAVYSLTLAMAADHVREGIRVNCVTPGTADTPGCGRLLDAAPTTRRPNAPRSSARQPMGRLVSADEVAAAIAYLASPLAASTTGTALAVDGGMPVDGGMQGLRTRPRPAERTERRRRMTRITGVDTFDVRSPTSRTWTAPTR